MLRCLAFRHTPPKPPIASCPVTNMSDGYPATICIAWTATTLNSQKYRMLLRQVQHPHHFLAQIHRQHFRDHNCRMSDASMLTSPRMQEFWRQSLNRFRKWNLPVVEQVIRQLIWLAYRQISVPI